MHPGALLCEHVNSPNVLNVTAADEYAKMLLLLPQNIKTGLS